MFLPQSGNVPAECVPDIKTFRKRKGNIGFEGEDVGNVSSTHSTRRNIIPRAFYHNPIHDVESLWWICVEKVLTKQVLIDGEPIVDEARFKEQWRTAANIFPSDLGAKSRTTFLHSKYFFNECMATLEPRMAGVVKALGKIRSQLLAMFEMVEATAPVISCDGFNGKRLYTLVGMFGDLTSEAKGMTLQDFEESWIRGVTARDATERTNTKRKRTSETVLGPFRSKTSNSTDVCY